MTNLYKSIALLVLFFVSAHCVNAQGCSDAGFCTLGSHEPENTEFSTKNNPRSELDIQYTSARHNHNERFSVPQINYRYFNKKGSYFEVRLPFNMAKDNNTGISHAGIGDITATYNSSLPLGKHHFFSYSTGLRVSFSHADATDDYYKTSSEPMFLQSGLGTTDFIGVVNYQFLQFLSIGTGVQIPFLQYNKNQLSLLSTSFSSIAYNYHRQPDALLRLDGNVNIKKLAITGGLVGIFHLKNDYYESYKSNVGVAGGIDMGRYELINSKGTTINFDINFRYPITKKIDLGLLYAVPLKTRSNIPDGLARSQVITPKLTFAF